MTTVKSKGRQMEEICKLTSSEEITKMFKGYKTTVTKFYYDVTLVTDYGKEIKTKAYSCYPSHGYYLPNGNVTANKWDLYELYKSER